MNMYFVFADGRIVTPETGTILEGITRASIIELAGKLGHQVEERKFSIDEWRDGVASGEITEVFACGTARGGHAGRRAEVGPASASADLAHMKTPGGRPPKWTSSEGRGHVRDARTAAERPSPAGARAPDGMTAARHPPRSAGGAPEQVRRPPGPPTAATGLAVYRPPASARAASARRCRSPVARGFDCPRGRGRKTGGKEEGRGCAREVSSLSSDPQRGSRRSSDADPVAEIPFAHPLRAWPLAARPRGRRGSDQTAYGLTWRGSYRLAEGVATVHAGVSTDAKPSNVLMEGRTPDPHRLRPGPGRRRPQAHPHRLAARHARLPGPRDPERRRRDRRLRRPLVGRHRGVRRHGTPFGRGAVDGDHGPRAPRPARPRRASEPRGAWSRPPSTPTPAGDRPLVGTCWSGWTPSNRAPPLTQSGEGRLPPRRRRGDRGPPCDGLSQGRPSSRGSAETSRARGP